MVKMHLNFNLANELIDHFVFFMFLQTVDVYFSYNLEGRDETGL